MSKFCDDCPLFYTSVGRSKIRRFILCATCCANPPIELRHLLKEKLGAKTLHRFFTFTNRWKRGQERAANIKNCSDRKHRIQKRSARTNTKNTWCPLLSGLPAAHLTKLSPFCARNQKKVVCLEASHDCQRCRFSYLEYVGGLHNLVCGVFGRTIVQYIDETNGKQPADTTAPDWCKLPVVIERTKAVKK